MLIVGICELVNGEESDSDFLPVHYAAMCSPSCFLIGTCCMMYRNGELYLLPKKKSFKNSEIHNMPFH